MLLMLAASPLISRKAWLGQTAKVFLKVANEYEEVCLNFYAQSIELLEGIRGF